MFKAINDGLHMIGHTFSVIGQYPVFILPLLGCWCIYAPLILYFKFSIPWEQQSLTVSLLLVFAAIFVLSAALSFSALVVLAMIQHIETGKEPDLLRAIGDAMTKSLVRALPIIVVWAALWFFLAVLSAMFSKRDGDSDDNEMNVENAARTLAGGGFSIFSIKNLIRLLNKALRMIVFLILPAIAWTNCGPIEATKRGFTALRKHLGQFATGFILSEGVALIIGIPIGLLLYLKGDHPLPDIVWLGVIFYCAFGWSFVMYVEQMFAAELFLWHVKWERENKKLAEQNLPPVSLSEVERPSLLDNVYELLEKPSSSSTPDPQQFPDPPNFRHPPKV